MNTVTVANPVIPYRQRIGFPLENGSQIFLSGTTSNWCDRFIVNLEVPNGNVSFHISIRYNDQAVVRNTLRQGQWGNEERHGGFPLAKGQPFQMMILSEEHEFKLAFNGAHHSGFRHRLPKKNIQFLVVEGDVVLHNVMIQPAQPITRPAPVFYPPALSQSAANVSYPSGHHHHHHHHQHAGPTALLPIYSPSVPYNKPIGERFGANRIIRISGMPHTHASRFNVNLVNGPGYEGNADIALHMDIRFRFGSSYNTIVRNSKSRGNWQTEETQITSFPFQPNHNFDILLLNDGHSYKVAVNNQHLFEFRHRMPEGQVSYLNISGDVTIHSIQVQ